MVPEKFPENKQYNHNNGDKILDFINDKKINEG